VRVESGEHETFSRGAKELACAAAIGAVLECDFDFGVAEEEGGVLESSAKRRLENDFSNGEERDDEQHFESKMTRQERGEKIRKPNGDRGKPMRRSGKCLIPSGFERLATDSHRNH
jgi:hypothetical protein